LIVIYASFLFRLQAPTRPGREQGADDSSSSQGLIAGLTASILAVVIIIGFFAYRRGYLKLVNFDLKKDYYILFTKREGRTVKISAPAVLTNLDKS